MGSAFEILTSYPSSGPHPDYQDKLMLFGQFEGFWDMEMSFLDDDGNITFQGNGEWAFAWVLDGRVMQDVLTFPDLKDPTLITPGKRNIGTSLRHYNPKDDIWRVVWIGASSNNLCFLQAKEDYEDILLERNDEGSSYLQWRFSDITDNSFHWTGHYSKDAGETWILEQEMFATRRKDI